MIRTCLGLAMTTRFTCGPITSATAAALPVASMTTSSSLRSCSANACNNARRISTRPRRVQFPRFEEPPPRQMPGGCPYR